MNLLMKPMANEYFLKLKVNLYALLKDYSVFSIIYLILKAIVKTAFELYCSIQIKLKFENVNLSEKVCATVLIRK